ncbi:recombinase family protein [Sulfitobacter geojensis]|uniref:recombinase family protein n=1 Tax=Sulfitobacter geojensis TaxID=1342299 RepID=UPI00046A14F0|nr:recombinase family protein [Sulfitobacter geojensis]NYI28233.1 DNA invertase Pin-like site-specific DNA recombinase [Sulfitobacter geojensis]
MNSIGYARISTSGQTLDAQLEQLGTAGCDCVFQETMSGARSDRPELRKALVTLSEGDVLIITRLDRLARSTRDLLDIVHEIETKGAKLKALTDSWADTTTPTGKLILTVLGGLAEFERSLIAERTAEGRERARRAGRRLGRPPKLSQFQRDVVLKMRLDGQDNAEIARVLGVSRSTVSRIK